MGVFKNFLIGTLGVAVIGGATALAIPQSRNFVLDKIAEQSEIYKTAMDNNSKLEQDNKDLQETSSAQADAIAKLKTDLDTKSTALTKCQGDLETVTVKKTELETTLASKEIVIQNLTQDKTDLTTQLTTANSEKGTLQSQLETANSEKSELQTTVTNLTSSVEILTAQKSTLETQLATSEGDKQALQTQLDSVNTQLETVQSDLATAQSDLATKTSVVENLTSQLAEKQTQIDSLTSQLSANQSELDQANSDKSNLQSQLDSANAQISTLQSQISTLETEKADLQKQVDDLTASAEVVVTKHPFIDFTYFHDGTGTSFCLLNGSSGHVCSTRYVKPAFDKVNYLTREVQLGYTCDFSFENNLFETSDIIYDGDSVPVNNLHGKFFVGTSDDNIFIGDDSDFFSLIMENSQFTLNAFTYEYKLSEDGSEFDDFTINFYLEQFELDNSKATNIYKSSTSDNTISTFSALDCLTFNGSSSPYRYTFDNGIYTVYNNDNSIYTTIDMSADSQQFTWNGETYILQEPDVTADNFGCYIGNTVDGVWTVIEYGPNNKYIKFGDNNPIAIEFISYNKDTKTMTLKRTDTNENFDLTNVHMSYNVDLGTYSLGSAIYNGVELAC